MSRDLGQRLYVRVSVEAHGGASVPETACQFHGLYALLMPEGGPAMAKRVWTYRANRAHASAHSASAQGERDTSSKRLGKQGVTLDPPSLTLTFCGFPAEPHSILEYIVGDQAQGFGDSGAELLHRHDGDDETVGYISEDRDNLGSIGRVGLGLDDPWEFDAAVTGDVRDTSEVEDLAELTNEEAHGAGPIVPLKGGDPGYYLLDVEFVYRRGSKVAVNAFLSRHDPGTRAFGDSAAARYPLIVNRIEATLWHHRSPELHLWVQPRGEPVRDEFGAPCGLAASFESPSMLERRIPTALAVLHVEAPRSVRKGSGSNVQRRQEAANLANVRHACVMGSQNMPVCSTFITSRETVRADRVAPEPAELCGVAVRQAPIRTSDVRYGCAMSAPAVLHARNKG